MRRSLSTASCPRQSNRVPVLKSQPWLESNSYKLPLRISPNRPYAKSGGVDVVKIRNKVGTLVSETKIGLAGVEQTTPGWKIRHMFK